jgi:hypothetical protein
MMLLNECGDTHPASALASTEKHQACQAGGERAKKAEEAEEE